MREKFRKYLLPMEPGTATARIRGLTALFAEGAAARTIWGYAATGQPCRFGSPYMLGDWDAAIEDFEASFPDGASREEVKQEAVRRLRAISLAGVE